VSKDRFGYGTYQEGGEAEKPSLIKRLFSGKQIPFSEKLYNKMFSEDDRNYWALEEKLGKDIVKKHLEIFQEEYVSKNPDLTLADFNKYLSDWASNVESEGMQGGGPVKRYGY
tara:strand:- start:116 stop:454 length:339 start_codon:yes stop_codon:yes gene_type:complete